MTKIHVLKPKLLGNRQLWRPFHDTRMNLFFIFFVFCFVFLGTRPSRFTPVDVALSIAVRLPHRNLRPLTGNTVVKFVSVSGTAYQSIHLPSVLSLCKFPKRRTNNGMLLLLCLAVGGLLEPIPAITGLHLGQSQQFRTTTRTQTDHQAQDQTPVPSMLKKKKELTSGRFANRIEI